MKFVLLLLFIAKSVSYGPYTWSRADTGKPFEYASEAECDAVLQANAEEWIAAEKVERKTDDVRLFWECHALGIDI